MNKEEAIRYLNYYFLDDGDGQFDITAVEAYQELKRHIEHLEQYTDKFCKIIIYLLRKYKNDLIKDFQCETNDFTEWLTLISVMDKIAEKMNEEMPEPWYMYGFGEKKDV